MSTDANSQAAEAATDSLLGGSGRASTVDFGRLRPQYHAPMLFPNEVELYEPTVRLGDGRAAAAATAGVGARTVQAHVDVALPCGYFNVWRPLHPRHTAVSERLQRYMVQTTAAAAEDDDADGQGAWSSRVSYSAADDEYYQNGVALPFVKGWQRGALHAHNVFRKVEHDWGMAYLAPTPDAARQPAGIDERAVAVWRFSYAESHGVVDAVHVRAGFAVFDETAAVRWHVRRLDRVPFERVAVHELTPDELQGFPEAAGSGVQPTAEGLARRARVLAQHAGALLTYRVRGDEHNAYAVVSLPGYAADLSRHVAGAYGFELAAELQPAERGADRWQKAQVARQSLRQPVAGRLREGEAAMARCGLDVRVRLRADVPVDAAAVTAAAAGVRMDDAQTDFVVHVRDPANTVGALQPPIGAHARVLAAGSEYFAALLASRMSEAAARSVALEDMPYGAARVALGFLYSAEVADADTRSLDAWLALMAVAARLAIPRLHQLCQARVLQHAVAAAVGSDTDADGADAEAERRLCPAAAALFARLHAAAAENGADLLAAALDRIAAHYAVACQEHAMRCADTADYAPPQPPPAHAHTHPHAGIDFEPELDGLHHLHLVPGMLVPQGHDDHRDDDEDAPHHHRVPHAQGFFGRLLGRGWRIVDDGRHDHHAPPPPAPQPGPVPHAPVHTETATGTDSDSDPDSDPDI